MQIHIKTACIFPKINFLEHLAKKQYWIWEKDELSTKSLGGPLDYHGKSHGE